MTATGQKRAPLTALLIAASLSLASPSHAANAQHKDIRTFAPAYFAEFEPDTAYDLVRQVPGFRIQQQGGGRGLANIRTNVLIDGERAPLKGQSTSSLLQMLPLRRVEKIELIQAGARPDIDMQGYNQLVNVTTVEAPAPFFETLYNYNKTGTGNETTVNSDGYSGSARGAIERGGHQFSASVNISRDASDSPVRFISINPNNPELRTSSRTHSESGSEQAQAAAQFNFGAHKLIANAKYAQSRSASAPVFDGPIAPTQTRSTNDSDSDQYTASLEYRAAPTNTLEAAANLVLSRRNSGSTSQFESASAVETSSSTKSVGETAARASVRWKQSDRLTLSANANIAYNSDEDAARLTSTRDERNFTSTTRVTELRSSADLDANWRPLDQLILQGNVGLERYEIEAAGRSNGAKSDLRWRANVAYKFAPNKQIVFEANRAIGQLSLRRFAAEFNFESDVISLGATSLDPERTQTYSLRYDQRFLDRGIFEVKAKRRQVENPIRSAAISASTTRPQNVSTEITDTLTAKFDYPLDTLIGMKGGLVFINGSLARSNTTDPITGEARAVSGMQSNSISAGLNKTAINSDWAYGVSASRNQYGDSFGVRSTSRRDPVINWRAHLEWRGLKRVTARVNVSGGQETRSRSYIFDRPRAIGLDPSFVSVNESDAAMRYSASVEWRPRKNIELRANAAHGGARTSRNAIVPFGIDEFDFRSQSFAAAPTFSLQLRVTN